MNRELETFAKRLHQAITKQKLSMEELNRLTNDMVFKQAISKYEAAKIMPCSPYKS